ncbi:hypothetical protein BKA66DRAFT_571122 [Pyrenochaeta sp. MPI-SDFR-AT-0127]|nr:hypothetical protein BKA66DRAFT_571122 [Pyrenochaeta sp. MPI-SDFR-AT-0127]
MALNKRTSGGPGISQTLQKRPSQDDSEHSRSKRGKYASTACNDCKRCKVKCIRLNDDPVCQRCASMGAQCVIIPTATQMAKEKDRHAQQTCTSRCVELAEEVSALKQQLSTLTATVSMIVEKQSSAPDCLNRRTPCSQSTVSTYANSDIRRDDKARQPNFVGPTRSAFGFHVAESSLALMGIPTGQDRSTSRSPTPCTRDATPTQPVQYRPPYTPVGTGVDILLGFSEAEIVRFLGIYQDEVVAVHPILDTEYFISNLPHLLNLAGQSTAASNDFPHFGAKDLHILRVAIATAMTHEVHSDQQIRDELIGVVDNDLGRITSVTQVGLKDLQIMGMLSIYFCHTEEELFAWRAIGKAARHALEMGLNHSRSLFDNFPDIASRKMATQVFWTVYQLDRRWSFGTSLSFALNDKDIDSDLPEPGQEFPYLKCTVAYGRLCSRIWEALPPYGSTSLRIPQETEEYLDFIIQNWRASIPDELRLRYTEDELTTQISAQPRVLHRLRTLLHLRGNYIRLLIHRHHVLDHENGKSDTKMVQLVVNIAKNSIQVLVDFNNTSDIYRRQPSVYHHYLVAALSVLLLAVCHAPNQFTETCRLSFVAALELLKSLSRHGTASRKLWKSISGVLPFVRSLTLRKDQQQSAKHQSDDNSAGIVGASTAPNGRTMQGQEPAPSEVPADVVREPWIGNTSHVDLWPNSEPDIFNISSDLMDLYDAFGTNAINAPQLQYDIGANNFGEQTTSNCDLSEISRHFEGLI